MISVQVKCLTYFMLGRRWGGCLGANVSRFFSISAGSLILGILGLIGDILGSMACWDLGAGLGDAGAGVKDPDCHTHLKYRNNILKLNNEDTNF
jgi:hypothetical protein